jgi:hypothetical protein
MKPYSLCQKRVGLLVLPIEQLYGKTAEVQEAFTQLRMLTLHIDDAVWCGTTTLLFYSPDIAEVPEGAMPPEYRIITAQAESGTQYTLEEVRA